MEAGVLWREEVQLIKDKEFKKVELKNHFNKLNPASIFIIKKNPKKINKPYFLNPFKKNDKPKKTQSN